MTTRFDELRRQCNAYHKAHPEVWELFKQFTFERIMRGFKNYSSDAIFHRIRWELTKPTYRKGEEFKLNNNYTAFYGRRFMRQFPEHDGFFRTREQTSESRGATGVPEIGPEAFS